MKTVAIIPAGGSGNRMGKDIPKQYLLMGNMPILIHTLKVFQESTQVDDIFLILSAEYVKNAEQMIVQRYNLSKVIRILPGGKHRQDSVRSGVDALGAAYDIVVIHDGVRPFVSAELIKMVIGEAVLAGAVSVGVPVKDTIKSLDSHGFVDKTLNRNKLWLTQTPQAFSALLIQEAYRRAYEDDYYSTDDAALVERMGKKVKMLTGFYENIKITTESDLRWGELFLKMRSATSMKRHER